MILSTLRIRNFPEEEADQFPWTLPIIKNLEELIFEKNISFFVGENGSGKSTILEAIAAYTEVPLAGSFRLEDDESLAAANDLANYLSIRYAEKTRQGFFVRAEDFIGFSRNIKNQIKELDQEIKEVKESFTGGDINLTLGTIEGEKNQLIKRYSHDLEAMSHGEGFMKFFTSRITGKGLYLIDEPEAAPDRGDATEHFEISSPMKKVEMEDVEDLDDGPTSMSERRLRAPARAPPVKRRIDMHEEEPKPKKTIMTDDDDGNVREFDMSAIEARRVDERIVCQAIFGKNLHDVYANERIALEVLWRYSAPSERVEVVILLEV